ncbi:MAG: class E sortase [Microbacteriaceae bacterium]
MRNKLLGIIGELLIMAGLLVGGFVVWQQSQEAQIASDQGEEAKELFAYWEKSPDEGFQPEIGWQQPDYGRGFAIIRIPKFGEDYQRIIAEGVGPNVMNDRKTGVGHYPGTTMPGDFGNFALAAHRLGNGGPFLRVNELLAGDEILITSGETTWVYAVTRLETVRPQQTEVLDAVPGKRELTMTTCHPMYQWHQRLIVKAELVKIIKGNQETLVGSALSGMGEPHV